MNAWIAVAGIAIAALGQKLKANENIPTPVVQLGLVVAGLLLYLPVEVPKALYGPGLMEWLDTAYLFALALPGAASLIGSGAKVAGLKGMETAGK